MELSRLKILIVEDDRLIAESLNDILKILNHLVVGLVDNAEQAMEVCSRNLPDLVLLDIQISGENDGVELAELIREKFNIPFIFMTAYADNATIIRAREKGPFGYLVKPYGIKEVNAAIQIAKASFERLKTAEKTIINLSKEEDDSLFLKVANKLIKVKIEEILYVEAKGDYALFKTKEKGFIVQTTMKHVEERLTPFFFQKIHRSFIVNLSKIVDIEESNLLIEERIIPISRANKEALINRLNLL